MIEGVGAYIKKDVEQLVCVIAYIKKIINLCDSLTPHPRQKKSCNDLTKPQNCNIQRHKTPPLFSRKRIIIKKYGKVDDSVGYEVTLAYLRAENS